MSKIKATRLKRATRDLEEIQARIAPFTKKRKRGDGGTAGQWQNTRRAVTRRSNSPSATNKAN